MRLLCVWAVAFVGKLGIAAQVVPSRPVDPADFKWDLSYASALAAHPMRPNEFLPAWIGRYPKRPVHVKLASYAGEKIIGSLLMEQPDGHTGDPYATWVIRTRSTARVCTFHPKFMDRPCESVVPARVDAFLRQVMGFAPSRTRAIEDVVIGKDDKGAPILFNYVGFLSVWVDGRSLQRPISALEIAPLPSAGGAEDPSRGQLALAFAGLTLPPEELAVRKQAGDRQAKYAALENAARHGDIAEMSRWLAKGAPLVGESDSGNRETLLSVAVASGQTAAVDLLLQRGADIDGVESAALKAAVEADNSAMLLHLLAKGAKVGPTADRAEVGGIYESALAFAIRRAHPDMARLLLDRGADVNIAQARSIVAIAALSMDPALVASVLERGARVDQVGSYTKETPLLLLMSYAGNLSGPPTDPFQRAELDKRDAEVAVIARQLVAAGANVNFVDAGCRSVYGEAATRHSQTMMKELVALGADPEVEARCRGRRR